MNASRCSSLLFLLAAGLLPLGRTVPSPPSSGGASRTGRRAGTPLPPCRRWRAPAPFRPSRRGKTSLASARRGSPFFYPAFHPTKITRLRGVNGTLQPTATGNRRGSWDAMGWQKMPPFRTSTPPDKSPLRAISAGFFISERRDTKKAGIAPASCPAACRRLISRRRRAR